MDLLIGITIGVGLMLFILAVVIVVMSIIKTNKNSRMINGLIDDLEYHSKIIDENRDYCIKHSEEQYVILVQRLDEIDSKLD